MYLSNLSLSFKPSLLDHQVSYRYKDLRIPFKIETSAGDDHIQRDASSSIETVLKYKRPQQYHQLEIGLDQSCLGDSSFHSLLSFGRKFQNINDFSSSCTRNSDFGNARKLKRRIGPCQRIRQVLGEGAYKPGREKEFYTRIIKECRKYLEQSLLMKDRKRITRIYLKALEKLFRLTADEAKKGIIEETAVVILEKDCNVKRTEQDDLDQLTEQQKIDLIKEIKCDVRQTKHDIKKCKLALDEKPYTTSSRERADIESDRVHLQGELRNLKLKHNAVVRRLKPSLRRQISNTSMTSGVSRNNSMSPRTLLDSLRRDLMMSVNDDDESSMTSSPSRSLLLTAIERDLRRADSSATTSVENSTAISDNGFNNDFENYDDEISKVQVRQRKSRVLQI